MYLKRSEVVKVKESDKIQDLVNNAKRGDDTSFVELINFYKQNLYKMAFIYVRNEQDALDIVSDTVYKAYMNINKLRESQYFSSWIIKILINLSINKLKSNKNIIYVDDYSLLDKNSNISEMEFNISKNIDLYNAMDNLNIKYKNLIILKYFQDMTISQISKLLEYPEGTVKVYLRRALKKLKVELEKGCI
ncbi:RNA polymerase subunit sigma-70 [Clostridium tyrobutyricum]|nr:sigma-70 family RNA polymerase sigma factor [Clostridium tyrobutyricum]ANP70835.1 RNA polymerase subunit sigma-70 [Clostridium tyrobutyricum]